jgi:hypothetical protein
MPQIIEHILKPSRDDFLIKNSDVNETMYVEMDSILDENADFGAILFFTTAQH